MTEESRKSVLVTVAELAEQLDTAGVQRPVLLDVRWTLTQPDGSKDHAAGHIPGARYVSMDTELADCAPGEPARGRHPLPSAEVFEATVRSWGVRTGTPVIVYDDAGEHAAARAWWMLRWAGHRDVRVLAGGWSAWRAAGLPEETGASGTAAEAAAGSNASSPPFTIRPGSMPVLTADQAAALGDAPTGVLLDARAPERFQGLTEPMDPVAGHIPGAVNAPGTDDLDHGRMHSPEQLEARYRALGVRAGSTAVGAYCGSGVAASHTVLALASLGVEAALFPGSWSAWSNDPDRPVATGP